LCRAVGADSDLLPRYLLLRCDLFGTLPLVLANQHKRTTTTAPPPPACRSDIAPSVGRWIRHLPPPDVRGISFTTSGATPLLLRHMPKRHYRLTQRVTNGIAPLTATPHHHRHAGSTHAVLCGEDVTSRHQPTFMPARTCQRAARRAGSPKFRYLPPEHHGTAFADCWTQ